MNSLTFIKEQLEAVKEKTAVFIKNIPFEQWNTTPEILETNMNWQIGHLILANYLQGIASISGANQKVRERIDLPSFIKFYGPNSNPNFYVDEKPSNQELLKLYDFIFEIVRSELSKIDINDLHNPTEVPNPSAKTKYEALTTLFRHQAWHNGQIAILNRVLKS